ncbi:hypothetical protein GGR53DRAFT_345732 [Hypoxylon sp. FL1150]|nr:hypothetical protein GGR53DRAFT_345732 [Hypoxylon sp. FL1150]
MSKLADLLKQFPNLPPAEQQEILNSPGMTPPDGVEPNFDHPPNQNGLAIAISVICLFLVTFSASVRAYSKLALVKRVRLEDYLGLMAFAGFVGIACAYYTQLRYGGFFVRQWDVRLRDLQVVYEYAIIFALLYHIPMIFAKTAILLEWIHIFVPDHNRSRNKFFMLARFMMWLNILMYSSVFIAMCFSCIPLKANWTPWLTGKCIDKEALYITTASFNLVMDVFILLLPQKIIWNLQMTRNKKIGVSIIFSIGFLSVLCAAGRLYATQHLSYQNKGDTNYGIGPLYLWSFSEVTCTLLVFNIPGMPMAFTEGRLGSWMRRWQKSKSSKSSGTPTTWPRTNRHINEYHNIDGHSHAQLAVPASRDFRTPYKYGLARGDKDIIYLTNYKDDVNGMLRGPNGSNLEMSI